MELPINFWGGVERFGEPQDEEPQDEEPCIYSKGERAKFCKRNKGFECSHGGFYSNGVYAGCYKTALALERSSKKGLLSFLKEFFWLGPAG